MTYVYYYEKSDSRVACKPAPSPCPRSSVTLFFLQPNLAHVSDSARPSHYSTSDSRVAHIPTPSPHPRSALTHAHRFIGFIRNRTLVHVQLTIVYYSVRDDRVSSTPSPFPSHLYTTLPCSTWCVKGFSLLKLELFVFHNTDTFCLPPPLALALSVNQKENFSRTKFDTHQVPNGELCDFFLPLKEFQVQVHRLLSKLDI